VVGLVHDQVIVLGQHVAAGRHVREQQSVIDDQQMGGLGGQLGTIEGAASTGALQAGLIGTALVLSRQAQPDFALGRAGQVDLVAVAALFLPQPDQDFCQHAQFIHRLRSVLAQVGQAAWAQVIVATLEHSRAQLEAQGGAQVGDILLDQLLLQVDGVG
jgi:hypothetical protein